MEERKYKIMITDIKELKGRMFTERQLHEIYRDIARPAFPSFDEWFYEMLKCGIFQFVREMQYPCRGCNYFESCGDNMRTEPCKGRALKSRK